MKKTGIPPLWRGSGFPLFVPTPDWRRFFPDTEDPNLIALFRADEGSGTTTTDEQNGLVGTLVNNTSWVGSGPMGYSGEDSLLLDGFDDYVSVAYSPLLDFDVEDPWTVYFYVAADTIESGTAFMFGGNADYFNSPNHGYAIWHDDSDRINAQILTGSGVSNSFRMRTTNPVEVTDGNYHLVSAKFTGGGGAGTFGINLDGVNMPLTTVDPNLLEGKDMTTTDPLLLGIRSKNLDLDLAGQMTGVVVFSDVRSDAEILADFERTGFA